MTDFLAANSSVVECGLPSAPAGFDVASIALPRCNQAEFAALVDRCLGSTRRRNQGLSVLWLDIDRIDAVDGISGQRIGANPGAKAEASLLTMLAQRVHRRVRSTDHVVRVEGGGVGVILVGASADEASMVDARMRKSLDEPYKLGHSAALKLQLCTGLANFPQQGSRGSELVSRAMQHCAAPDPTRRAA